MAASKKEHSLLPRRLFTAQHSAALLPPALALFGLISLYGTGAPEFQASLTLTWLVTAYSLVSVFYFWTYRYTEYIAACSLIIFHILLFVYALTVVDFLDVSLGLWVPLMLSSFAYFGFKGFVQSAAVLLVAGFIGMLSEPAAQVIPVTLFIIFTSYLITRVMRRTEKEHATLARVRDEQDFEREQLLALINTLNDAVVATDAKGTIRLYNSSVLGLLDTNVALEGKDIDELLKLETETGESISIIAEANEAKRAFSRDDLLHVVAGNERINLAINITPIRPSFRSHVDGGFILTLRDITKRKSLEDERDEFISVVSHELRTPIAIAEGSLSNLIVLQDRGADAKVLAGSAGTAHEQIMYLSRMVNDLSTLSRAERGVGDTREDIDLNELLKNLYGKYEPEASAKNLHLNLDIKTRLPVVTQSRLYLEEMLQNFITNAIKYTQEGSVTISADVSAHGVECSVADTGIGISKSDQAKVFQKFYRSEDYRTRETSGTGLGLYVVHKLAAKMGVEIHVKSRLNHGSTFSFTLPLKDK